MERKKRNVDRGGLFSDKPSRKRKAKPKKPETEVPKKKLGRRPLPKRFKPATSTKEKSLSERETVSKEAITEAGKRDAKVRAKSSYTDFQKEEYLKDVEDTLKNNLPLVHDTLSSHTIAQPAQHSTEIRRDKDGHLSFVVKYYGRTVGETVLGAMSMLSRVDYNLAEYEKERKVVGNTKVRGRNLK